MKNSVLSQSISRNLSAHIGDAEIGIESLSASITRYDPFWYGWVLNNFIQAYHHFERLIYLDANGQVLASSPLEYHNPLAITRFSAVIGREPKILSTPVLSPISDNPIIYIGVRGDNGNMLIGELSLRELYRHVGNLLPTDEGMIILCDAYGKLISHPDFSNVQQQVNISNIGLLSDQPFEGINSSIYKDMDTYYLGTVSKVPETDWRLIIAKPLDKVFFPILSTLIALLTIILSLFFIFAHFLQHRLRYRVVLPLAQFTESIELTAKGRYELPQSGDRPSFTELSIIEEKFNDMVRQINLRETEIKESEERFRQLVENIHEVYWITDIADNRVIYASPSYEIIWARTRESLYDNPDSFFLAICLEDRHRVVEAVNQLRVEGLILAEEFKIILPDGKERWIRAQAYPIYDEEGVRVRLVGVADDITERKAIQQALIKAKGDAESASQAKTEFLTNMSHELRTPLNGILGMLQLTQATGLTQEQKDYIDTAVNSSNVLLNVINDILNIAQIEAGKLVLHEQPFSPQEVLETIFKFFTHATNSKDVELQMEMEPGFPSQLIGDEVRIRQILFNLVGNSVKFTEHGVISVYVEPLKIQRRKDRLGVLFTISDTGIGIPSNKIAYVFESFTQVDGTYTRRHQGTGLGLGIVKNLVDQMNGTIVVDSEEGQGTTMYVTLQLGLPERGQQLPKQERQTLQMHPENLSILVVEDDRVNQIAISRMLEKLHHQALCVDNGKKALEILREKTFDCIFMDIQMPILDGLDTTRQIRAERDNERFRTIPIVALTAHAMPEDREKFLKAGMNDYISKPVSFEQLAATLRRVTTAAAQS
ncbi:MAG: ATP-binding protein [Pseudodesulfovibrio sp.]|nr:ATP-binding protein [Pseudodesulfovibrio sp.]